MGQESKSNRSDRSRAKLNQHLRSISRKYPYLDSLAPAAPLEPGLTVSPDQAAPANQKPAIETLPSPDDDLLHRTLNSIVEYWV
ncbi:MAG: hypothetical protein ACO4AJ_07810 [Prochlorothrix sp.]